MVFLIKILIFALCIFQCQVLMFLLKNLLGNNLPSTATTITTPTPRPIIASTLEFILDDIQNHKIFNKRVNGGEFSLREPSKEKLEVLNMSLSTSLENIILNNTSTDAPSLQDEIFSTGPVLSTTNEVISNYTSATKLSLEEEVEKGEKYYLDEPTIAIDLIESQPKIFTNHRGDVEEDINISKILNSGGAQPKDFNENQTNFSTNKLLADNLNTSKRSSEVSSSTQSTNATTGSTITNTFVTDNMMNFNVSTTVKNEIVSEQSSVSGSSAYATNLIFISVNVLLLLDLTY